jgi:hypothetical protein
VVVVEQLYTQIYHLQLLEQQIQVVVVEVVLILVLLLPILEQQADQE